MLKRLLLTGLLSGLALAAAATPAAAAPAAGITVGDQGTLAARGAGVRIPVTYSCPEGTPYAEVSVRLTQRSGNRLADGGGFRSNLTCDGTGQTLELLVTAGGAPFHRGTALAAGYLITCDPFTCASTTTSREVRIVG